MSATSVPESQFSGPTSGPDSGPIKGPTGGRIGDRPAFAGTGTTPSVSVKPLSQIGSSERLLWERLRRTSPSFRPPFFSFAFAEAVHRSRGDVEVMVLEDRGETIGFLPFHRKGRVAYPVGRFFNDAHGVICDPAWFRGQDPTAPGQSSFWHTLLDQAGLIAFEFHALVGADQRDFEVGACHRTVKSFRCEIGVDPAGYLDALSRQHRTIGRQGQKTRKLERDFGPVDFEFDCRDPGLLQQHLRWKRDQYRRTHILDLFSPEWTGRLLGDLFHAAPLRRSDARGVLSVLRAGGRVVASHFGIFENGWLHYWFPAYDPAFAKYSPGTALFRSLLESAGPLGLYGIDMGYGEQPYKYKQTDSTGFVLQGCVSRSCTYRYYRCAHSRILRAVQQVPCKQPLKKLWRSLRPQAGISKLT